MKKFLFLLTLLVVAGVITAYNYLDFIAKKAIEKYGPEALGVAVTVGKVSVKLHEGKFTIKNIKIKNPNGFKYDNAIEIGQLSSQIDLRTIFKDVIVIHSISIDNPNIFYEIGPNGDNIKSLRQNTSSQKAADTKTSTIINAEKSKKVIIDKLFVNKAKVIAVIEHVTEKSLTLPDIYLQNIGKDSNGVTVANASDQVLRELTKSISKVNIKSLINDIANLPQNLDGVKSQVEEKINEFTGSINKLFGK